MPLLLEIAHSFGRTAVERGEREGRVPLVLGRGRAADVLVVGTGIAQRHCAVFFDADAVRWLVQDGNTRGRTLVNGVALPGSLQPCPLLDGFVVTLGDGADPPSVRVRVTPPEPGLDDDLEPLLPEHDAADEPDEAEGEELIDFGPVVAGGTMQRRGSSRNGRGVLPMMLACLASLAAGVAIGSAAAGRPVGAEMAFRPPEVTSPPALPPQDDVVPQVQPQASATRPSVVFDLTPDPSLETPDEVLARTADPAGLVGAVAGVSPLDPARASAAWAEVVRVEQGHDAAATLLAYDALLRSLRGPAAPLQDAVTGRREALVDRLWWEQVANLIAEEFAVLDRTLVVELRLRQGDVTGDEAASLRASLAADGDRLRRIDQELAVRMDYTADEVPDPDDADQLERLRATRDDEAFRRWRGDLLRVVAAQGRLPWDLPDGGGSTVDE